MKFSIRKMLACGLLAGVMTFCAAGAASFDNAAKSLSDLGLLTGSDTGFDLDRPSTRGEAAAMLVRLLGKEAEAQEAWKTDEASFAFTDMENAAWAKPYVNWLVKNGLAAGVTDTTFAPRDNCSAQMAATFLLRALGYSDAEGGDFSYFTAMDFAREKGVVDLANCNEKNFQRDHFVAMCYTTLACQPKSGEADLLSKLVTGGAVADNDASKAVRQLFSDYRDLSSASMESSDLQSIAAKMNMDIAITVDGEKMALSMNQDVAAMINPEAPDNMQMSMTGAVTIQDGGRSMSVPTEIYFRDGMMYMNSEGSKLKVQSSIDDAMKQAQLLTVQEAANSQTISAVESLTKTTAGGKTTYVLVCNTKAMRGMIDTVLGGMAEALPDLDELPLDFSVDKAVVTETVNAQGEPESMDMEIVMGMTIEDMTMQMEMKMDMEITGVGDAVKVTFPSDLDTYEDMLEAVPQE